MRKVFFPALFLLSTLGILLLNPKNTLAQGTCSIQYVTPTKPEVINNCEEGYEPYDVYGLQPKCTCVLKQTGTCSMEGKGCNNDPACQQGPNCENYRCIGGLIKKCSIPPPTTCETAHRGCETDEGCQAPGPQCNNYVCKPELGGLYKTCILAQSGCNMEGRGCNNDAACQQGTNCGSLRCIGGLIKKCSIPPPPPPPTECKAVDTALGTIPVCDLNSFAAWILRWSIGIGGGIAFLLILWSGFQIMTSAGNPERLKAGREQLTAAIGGLLFLIFSMFLLRLIGVDILQLPGFGG